MIPRKIDPNNGLPNKRYSDELTQSKNSYYHSATGLSCILTQKAVYGFYRLKMN